MANDVNVLVIGGGAAGLAAAAELEALGVSCQLVEAQSSLGGRVHTVAGPDGLLFERGAQMANADMSAVLALAEEAGLERVPTPAAGKALCVLNDVVVPRDRLISADELEALIETHASGESWAANVARLMRSVVRRRSASATTPREARPDPQSPAPDRRPQARSLGDAIERMRLSDEDCAVARTMICEQYGAAPERLDAAAMAASLGAYRSDRGDLELQFPGGMGRIIDRLRSKLSNAPVLEAPVTRIAVEGAGLRVFSETGSWRVSRVIVAAPPTAARDIDLHIEGRSELRHCLQAFEAGDMIKTTVVYDRAFWRRKGLGGAVTFARTCGLEVVDTSCAVANDARLTAFLGGPSARDRAAMSRVDREQRLLSDLVRALGPEAADPRRIDEAVWVDDRWSGGGYNATVRAGRRSDAVARLAAFPGPVRFACSELDDSFAGYVEGAIRRGRRVAREVAADLTKAAA
ncbi:MAG: FAD-dependent oxidoreductase [Pseudomonadota bacterium]